MIARICVFLIILYISHNNRLINDYFVYSFLIIHDILHFIYGVSGSVCSVTSIFFNVRVLIY